MFAPPAKKKWNDKPLPVNIKPHVIMIKVNLQSVQSIINFTLCDLVRLYFYGQVNPERPVVKLTLYYVTVYQRFNIILAYIDACLLI